MTEKKKPERMCIGCREMKPRKELLRVVRTADGTVGIDRTGKANGRGAYLCRSAECLKKAVKSRGLERAFKMRIPESCLKELEEEIPEPCLKELEMEISDPEKRQKGMTKEF